MSKIDELMDIVAAGDDLAAADAAFLCQRLDSYAWYRALERAGIASHQDRKAASQDRAADAFAPPRSLARTQEG
ncbi:hypothetical protein [Methylorubrum suomiense]|uniref:Uncharacterized protein n=1 Tax=Methylorubrum suomiense TaxID=144191 RepID=A0ABQ4UTP5_9HYPH|nr:hypothetical protein [Methylorubrum suomiense]GJE75546.1 hypothetical protein BGCPKDLD_2130 [Methylorubrum suomiense]